MKKVIIIGGGGHAKVIADIINLNGDEIVGFLDDDINKQGTIAYEDKKVLGPISDVIKYKDCNFIIGIGSNSIREKISSQYDVSWYTAIHPSAVIGSNVLIGEGTVIMPGVIINTGTKIGKHCIINTKVSLDHDNLIHDFVHISPGATLCGTVEIKKSTWICSGATIINNITINEHNVIGAEAVVVKNIDDNNSLFVGVPAKKVK